MFLQEAQEFQTGIDDLRYRRRAAGGSQKNAAPLASDSTPPDTKTIHVILSVYSKALQHTLQVVNLWIFLFIQFLELQWVQDDSVKRAPGVKLV